MDRISLGRMVEIIYNLNTLPSKSIYKTVGLLNLPKIGLNNPPMAPSLMQAIAKDMGCEVKFFDLNLEFHKHFNDDHVVLNDWCELGAETTPEIDKKLREFTDTLDLSYFFEADILGISIFSAHSQPYCTWFLNTYKSEIEGKIVLGGAGCSADQFGEGVFQSGLANFYVVNEGEMSWRAILADRLPWAGVNSIGPGLKDFEFVPVPDYSGYQLNEYLNSKVYGTTVGVEGSRGCVKNCTFCDIRSYWEKYKFKDGTKLAQELTTLKEKFNVKHFFFNDSLINGSDRSFRSFIQSLSQYNKNTTDRISWSAYYNIKSAGNYKPIDWQNLKDSGVKSLYIGIESGSQSVRNHMGKKFTDADIDDTMKNLQLYGIRCTWLLIVGYPTETEADFEQTLDLLRKYQHMAHDTTIDTVALGLTLNIVPGSPLEHLKDQLNIRPAVDDIEAADVAWENEHSNFKTRVLRRIRAEEVIRELGYNSWVGDNNVVSYFEDKIRQIEERNIITGGAAEHHG
jgi:radical SAM superfamily enzyme YgiQ (UPF0313 family)